jgi:hypothetical protein
MNKYNVKELLEYRQFLIDTVKLLVIARPSEFFNYKNNYCNLKNDLYADLKKRLEILGAIPEYLEFYNAAKNILDLMTPVNLLFTKMYLVTEHELNLCSSYYKELKSTFKIIDSQFMGLTDHAINEILLSINR